MVCERCGNTTWRHIIGALYKCTKCGHLQFGDDP